MTAKLFNPFNFENESKKIIAKTNCYELKQAHLITYLYHKKIMVGSDFSTVEIDASLNELVVLFKQQPASIVTTLDQYAKRHFNKVIAFTKVLRE